MPKFRQSQDNRIRYWLGVTILLSVVLIWVSSSFLVKAIFSDQDYNKPFFITYINTASFSLYLIVILIARKGNPLRDGSNRTAEYASLSVVPPENVVERISSYEQVILRRSNASEGTESPTHSISEDDNGDDDDDDDNDESEVADILSSTEQQMMTTRETAELGLVFCIIWFVANWSSNASLVYTSVSSSTILSSASGFFTLGIGALMGIEKFSWIKFVSVCISVTGVILISTSDDSASEPPKTADPLTTSRNPLLGDLLSLLGAFFYGCYATLLKLRVEHESRLNMPLFFGFVGVWNIILLWPIFGLLDLFGVEPFDLPTTPSIWALIIINALIGTFLSDYLWLLSMLMTSPLVATIGISLTIPLALMGDIVFKHLSVAPQYWLGAILLIVGFLIVNGVALLEARGIKRAEEGSTSEVLNDSVAG